MLEYSSVLKNNTRFATLRWKGVPNLPFAIRRVLMDEIPTIALLVNTAKTGTNYTVHANDSIFKNQDLMLRIALTPHCFSNSIIEKWTDGKFKCTIDVVNNTSTHRKVYSSDIRVFRQSGQVEWFPFNEPVFPADRLTGDHIELTVLEPGGKLSLEWFPELGAAYDHAAFSATSPICYSIKDDVTEITFASECGMTTGELIDNAYNKLIGDLVTIKRDLILVRKSANEWDSQMPNTRLTITNLLQAWAMQTIIKKKCKWLQMVGCGDVHPLEKTSVLYIGSAEKATEIQVRDELVAIATDLMQYLDDARLEALGIINKYDKTKVGSVGRDVITKATPTPTAESDSDEDSEKEEKGEDFGHVVAAAGLNLCPPEEGYKVVFDEHGQGRMEEELVRAKEYRSLIVKWANEVPKYMDITPGYLLKMDNKNKLSLAADVVQRCLLTQVWVRNVADIDPLFIYTDNAMFRAELLANMTTIYTAFLSFTGRESHERDPLGNEFKVHSKKDIEFICNKLAKVLLELIEKAAVATKMLINNLRTVPSLPVVKFVKKVIDKTSVTVPLIIWHTGNKRAINSFNHPHIGVHEGVVVVQYTGPKELLLRDPWAVLTSFFRYNYIEIGNQSLQKTKDEVDGIDGFSTPFNTHNPHFCSAYPDIDAPLGALAEFHTFCNGVADGSFDLSRVRVRHFAVNPPFVEAVMELCLEHILRMLKGERERGHKWTCSYIIPDWKTSKAYRDLSLLSQAGETDGITFEFRKRDDMKFRNAFTGESGVTLGKTKIVQGLFKNY